MNLSMRHLALLLVMLGELIGVHAQRSTHVRVFRPAGSYAANITVSPSGSVLSRSGDTRNLLILDGYTRREVAMEVETSYRVFQSRSSQLWSLTREGVQLYHGEEWTQHPIPEIREELANNPIRQLRQISLVPAEINHVFILLSDRLLDYDAGTGQVGLLKRVEQTGLGEFLEMLEGADDSIWISGARGFAQLPGPVRRINAKTEWKEYLLPNPNEVSGLQRPFEFPTRTVTASASSAVPDGSRYIVRLEEGRFSSYPILEEKIKQGWGGWDNALWGYSSTELFRIETEPEVRLRKEPVSGAQYDMACETNGVFWVASSEGLVRYAPNLWRPPVGLEDLQSSIYSLGIDRTGRVIWAASPEGLIRARGGEFEKFPWPDTIEVLVPPRDNLFVLENGKVLVGAEGRPLLFDPEAKRFSTPRTPTGVQVNLLGAMRDGRVLAWFEGEKDQAADLRLFDGDEFERMTLPAIKLGSAELVVGMESSRGELWLGTSEGVVMVRMNEAVVEYHGTEHGLGGERVTAIAELGEGRMWCGTLSYAYEFAERRWQKRVATEDRVNAIVFALGNIWVGTPAGLFRRVDDSWIEHGMDEGLAGGGVLALRHGVGEELWAGTSRGLVKYQPSADLDPPKTWPPVVQDPQTPSTLEPTVIRFHGNDKWDYTLPEDLLYSYKLDESPWTPFSNTVARVFQNLSSGSHVIEVRAMDRNGNESAGTSRVEFAVIVPWFQDPRLLVVSVFAGCLTLILAGYAMMKHLQLKRSYAEVEKIVEERTGELKKANQELLHSQKMRAIGTMAAGIAHDFNNILSIIKGSAQIIEGNVEDKEKIKTRVNRIQTVVEQGTSIVKALLGLGRMNEQELSACDVSELLRETRKLLTDRFSAEVRFVLEVEETVPAMVCSREVVQQMLINFILNAVEAMGGKGEVVLSAKEIQKVPREITILDPAKAETYVMISVTDKGNGIPAETLPRIFEPFFTTKGFSSRRGTGLGLSMVYELAKGLGYGVAVRSVLGEGSSFSILLPQTANPVDQEEKMKGRSSAFEGGR